MLGNAPAPRSDSSQGVGFNADKGRRSAAKRPQKVNLQPYHHVAEVWWEKGQDRKSLGVRQITWVARQFLCSSWHGIGRGLRQEWLQTVPCTMGCTAACDHLAPVPHRRHVLFLRRAFTLQVHTHPSARTLCRRIKGTC